MMNLSEVVRYLDQRFIPAGTPDYPNALNGLQLENSGKVSRLAVAVDASEKTISSALEEGADFLLVHHGLYWSGLRPFTGAFYRKIRKAMEGDLAIYSLHLPLDHFTEVGNSRLLAQAIGLSSISAFADWKGLSLGAAGEWDGDLTSLSHAVSLAVGGGVQTVAGRGQDTGKVCVVSGGSGDDLENLARQGAQTLIVGEGAHWTVLLAEELRVNLLYAGHYATETFGVRALGQELSALWGLPCRFVDHPTGR